MFIKEISTKEFIPALRLCRRELIWGIEFFFRIPLRYSRRSRYCFDSDKMVNGVWEYSILLCLDIYPRAGVGVRLMRGWRLISTKED